MKKIALITVLIIVLVFCFASCSEKSIVPNDIDSIEIREGSLKSTYMIDEEIDFSNVYIVIKLKNGEGLVTEKVSSNMLEGFDVSTTTEFAEMRSMRIKYMGFYTSYWYYEVTNENDINTNARILLKEQLNNGTSAIDISLSIADISCIYAFSMEISFDKEKYSYNNDIQSAIDGWIVEKGMEKNGSFIIVFYALPGINPIVSNSKLLTLSFLKLQSGGTIIVENISVSDRSKDIYLPDASIE